MNKTVKTSQFKAAMMTIRVHSMDSREFDLIWVSDEADKICTSSYDLDDGSDSKRLIDALNDFAHKVPDLLMEQRSVECSPNGFSWVNYPVRIPLDISWYPELDG